MNNLDRTPVLLHKTFSLWVAASLVLLTTKQLRAELPSEAQEAFDKGVIAAKEQNYPSAIRFFQDARKIAPTAPEIFYNLGLVESKIPGRELRSIAWFGAFLAANPTAPNAVEVWHEIEELDQQSHRNTRRLIEMILKAAEDLPNPPDHGPHTDGCRRDYALHEAGSLYARCADFGTARRIIGLIQNVKLKDTVYCAIIDTQLESGDIAGARRTYGTMRDPDQKSIAAEKIYHATSNPEQQANLQNTPSSTDDWIGLFKQHLVNRGLSEPYFVDLAGTLRSQPVSESAFDTFENLPYIAFNIAYMQRDIDRMLRQMPKP